MTEGVLILAALATGFVLGATWMWRIANQAIDEFDAENRP